MTVNGDPSLLDLLDLPDPQRELLLWLARHHPAGDSTLTHSTCTHPPAAELNEKRGPPA